MSEVKVMLKNEAQEQVIQNTDGQMIVIACPGSGKTTTILRRIHHMTEEGIDPSSILMITFAKDAAREMKDRYSHMYGENPGITFCTIHALCLSVLCKFGGYSTDCVLRRQDAEDYILPLLRYNDHIQNREDFINNALTDISVVKNNRLDVKNFVPSCCKDPKLFQDVYHAYENGKEKDGFIDYDDMILLALQMVQEERDVLDFLRDRYAYIHVDEYQDTNPLQRDFIYKLTGPEGNLTVVGDDDQSIYSFRGAEPEIMLNFKKDYPDAKEVYMTTNYRSDKDIIHASDTLIQKNIDRFSKEFAGHSEEKGSVQCQLLYNRDSELYKVTSEIRELLETKEKPEEIAVLYRLNAQASALAKILQEEDIPYHSSQKIEDLYQSSVFQDIESYLKIARGEGNKTDFQRTVLHPNRWLSGVDFEKTGLNEKAMISQLEAKVDFSRGWRKAQYRLQKIPENVCNYLSLMKELASLPVEKAIDVLYQRGGYKDYLEDLAEWRNESSDFLLSQVDSLQKDVRKNKLKDFYEWEAWISARKASLFKKKKKAEAGITLSTMHGAKGLEWNHVFLIDCIDSYNPYHRKGKTENEEEERRLFYVAMTRARHDLRLYTYRFGEKEQPIRSSRFLKEAEIL